MFGLSRFESVFGPFMAKPVQSSGFLEGLKRVKSSVLASDFIFRSVKFERVRSSFYFYLGSMQH